MQDESNVNHRPAVAVRAIITNEHGQILLLQRTERQYGEGSWCLPGGKVDYGQTAVEALACELQEELAVQLVAADFLFYQDSLPITAGGPHFINLYFYCCIAGEIAINAESAAWAWVGRDGLANYPIVFRNDAAIQRFYDEFYKD